MVHGALVLSVVRQNPGKDTGSCVLIAINDKNYVKQNVFWRLKDIETQGHLMKQILRVIVYRGSVFSGNGITCYIISRMLHLKMCSWLVVCMHSSAAELEQQQLAIVILAILECLSKTLLSSVHSPT